ncbi:MAG: diaminopimelate dehydrogenase [Clostridia bacterium]|nr:diaminopimelate dehydrogenase [Clostridia bacterium]MBR6647265.1 diaminopimelate dehydrogenase [Clostridia bacterium]
MTLKIGILGYGNLGRGLENAIAQNSDMELVGVFTRRAPETVKPVRKETKVYKVDDISLFKDKIDVLMLCGGSATDLPEQGPKYSQMFNCIDSFDTHAKIPEYFEAVDKAAKAANKASIISVGWDPGLFSLQRLLFESVLADGKTYTFWGKGVSQGHSDAIRRIEGVKNAKQYTIPVESAVEGARSGNNPDFTTREKHLRECFVVVEDGADKERIENEIKTMPNYFADYDTTVHFITEEEMIKNHSGIPHGGFVIRSGKTGEKLNSNHVCEFSLKLDSNPEFTSSVLLCYARAAYRFAQSENYGAKTVFDVPPAYLSPKSADDLRKELL